MNAIGRYRLDRCVGSGAFATVWQGWDPELDTAVAVKILADNWVQHADVRERFLSEARLLRRIESRRVVRVHDVGIADDRPYFVMDYVHGGTLADRVGKLEPDEAVRLAVEAAEAVHVLHEAGFVHRDVKPSNLLLDQTCEPSRVLVADLGSAKRLADATGFTVTTGTPAYMAPEQTDGSGGFDGRADVYSLAVVTWELLTGSRPVFSGRAAGRRRGDGRTGQRTSPSPPADLTPGVVAVLTAALSSDPALRPLDARAFAHALVTARDGTISSATKTWPTVLVAAVALLVFATAVIIGWLLL